MCNDCNNCLSKEEVLNLINNSTTVVSTGIPIGVVMYITNNDLLSNFDSTGKGVGTFNGWAICNGNNGTQNLSGRVLVARNPTDFDFNIVGGVGGSKTHTLVASEIPLHNHDYDLISHDHSITDPGHTHIASSDNQLSSVSLTADGGDTYSVTNGAITTNLNFAEITIETAAAATPGNVQFLVKNVPAIGTLVSSGSDNYAAIQAASSVVIPDHNHGNPNFTHNHAITINSNTTGITVDVEGPGIAEQTTTVGSDGSHNNLQPYFVAVPIQKIT